MLHQANDFARGVWQVASNLASEHVAAAQATATTQVVAARAEVAQAEAAIGALEAQHEQLAAQLAALTAAYETLQETLRTAQRDSAVAAARLVDATDRERAARTCASFSSA